MTTNPLPDAPLTGSAALHLDELAARVAQLTAQVSELEQAAAERAAAAGPATENGEPDQKPVYDTVEAWVATYLLPTFPRPIDQVGLTRWHWCEQWWRHDEAVTRLTALWYGWEYARLQMTGMLTWLRELDHHLPILCGEDGPFRDCATHHRPDPRPPPPPTNSPRPTGPATLVGLVAVAADFVNLSALAGTFPLLDLLLGLA